MKPLKDHFTYQLLSEDDDGAFWGREEGRKVREQIENALSSVDAGQTLVVDLKPVEVMDFSFSSEVFGKLIGRLGSEYPGRMLVLSTPSPYVKENLGAALDALGLMALAYKGPRSWELIGKWAETDLETLEALQRLNDAAAPQLAEALGIQLTTCNQRLRKLVEAGIVARTRAVGKAGGDQYVYRWPMGA